MLNIINIIGVDGKFQGTIATSCTLEKFKEYVQYWFEIQEAAKVAEISLEHLNEYQTELLELLPKGDIENLVKDAYSLSTLVHLVSYYKDSCAIVPSVPLDLNKEKDLYINLDKEKLRHDSRS